MYRGCLLSILLKSLAKLVQDILTWSSNAVGIRELLNLKINEDMVFLEIWGENERCLKGQVFLASNLRNDISFY